VNQLSIDFDAARLARKRDPETSRAAAEATGSFRARHIALIAEALRTHGPMTAHEIAAVTRLDNVQVSRRGKEMTERGLVTIGPDQRSGCRVWRAA
jgi:predicted ArsR family transcriptional regulator